MARRPHALTGPHKYRFQAIDDWDEADAGTGDEWVVVRHTRGWYAFDREAFETDDEAATRLEEYLDEQKSERR